MTAPLRGRNEVLRLQATLDATFLRIADIPDTALEARADFARYLCIRVAGFVEASLRELALQMCRTQAPERIAAYASSQIKFLRNAEKEKTLQFIGAFSQEWRRDLETTFGAELDALSSVVANRHALAHGSSVDMSYVTVSEYWQSVKKLTRHLTEFFDPADAH